MKAEKSYMIPFVGMFDYGMFGYIYEFGESPINCQIQAFVTISVQFYDKLDFDNHLCEGNIIPINNSLFTLTEKVNSYFNYQNAETLRNPIFLISAVDDSDQWETITQSDLTFNGFRDFVSQHFPGKSIFDDRFKIKVKFLLFETEPVLLPQYYRNYPLKDNSLNVKDSTLYIGTENIATGGKISIRSDFYSSTNKGEISLDNSNYINQEFGYFKTPLHGPYTITFHKDEHCPVSRYVFVPEVTLNKVNGSGNVFWYEGETRKAVSLHLKYPEGEDDNYHFSYKTNNGLEIGKGIEENDDATDDKISVLDPEKYSNPPLIKDCKAKSVDFTTDKSLKKIDVTVTSLGKKFIPVHINFEEGKLQAYPNIDATLSDSDITPPVCNGSDVSVKISDVKGGLGEIYTFAVGNGYDLDPKPKVENGIWSVSIKKNQIESGSSLETISLSIFDAKVPPEDKFGRDARSKSFSFTVKRPQKLEITEVSSTNLRCFQDKSGSIEITKVNRSYEDEPVLYHWYIYPNTENNQEIKKVDSNPIIEGLSKNDYVVKITNNECEFTSDIISIDEPPLLQFTQISPIDAQCFNYSNGSIFTTVDGGTPFEDGGYRYAWNVGAITNNLLNIPAGNYHLTVTDAHDCEAFTEIEITQPAELINSLTPSYTICKGSELAIDDGKENMKVFDSYEWHLPNGTTKPGRPIVVTSDMPQGEYVLVSKKNVPDTKDKFCFTTDTTTITFADNDLPIRFLVPTESFFDDTLVIAEDSEIDDYYTWHYAYNHDMFTDITKRMTADSTQTFLRIERFGNDTITMYAENGFCKASLSKAVTIHPESRPEDYDYTIASAGIFSRLQIGPNPNNGEFTLFANLTEDSPLTISLYDVMRSRKIPIDFSKYKTPASHYQIPFQGLGLRSGAYTLLVSANGETKQIKFVVE
ncbi:MAG: SprB repeat-containing protein [Bacteroidales bacterium]|nr:SprB repeat-containing protein [Bacteroidales bacterium]